LLAELCVQLGHVFQVFVEPSKSPLAIAQRCDQRSRSVFVVATNVATFIG